VNKPSPAIVAQSAVRRLPRLALWLFCLAYVLPGFFGRTPWKTDDIAAFGVMRSLAEGGSNWLAPLYLGQSAHLDSPLPHWLGALAILALPFLDAALASRLPFAALLGATLVSTWYAVYHLAQRPQAQPVAFAFGGEAKPTDYARAIADAGLLALIACLGLAQLSHETTPAVAQLAFCAVTFYALAARSSAEPIAAKISLPTLGLGAVGLALSGAPSLAALLGAAGIAIELAKPRPARRAPEPNSPALSAQKRITLSDAAAIAGVLVLVSVLAWSLDLWRWRIRLPSPSEQASWDYWRKLARLLLWFTWPAGPLALWTLWRWRRQLGSLHVALPLWFVAVITAAALLSSAADRTLLLCLPMLATLAAFALPTLKRSVASLIDWFTLLFFSSCALIIWVVWIAMQTGIPKQPAANVARLAPGFEPDFAALAFVFALAASLAWAWLVKWRASAQRAAIWKSLVLPASGATLCWLLLMTLWLPLLDYARSYAPLSRRIASLVDQADCVEVYGLTRSQVVALEYHGALKLKAAAAGANCAYLLASPDFESTLSTAVNLPDWAFLATVRRPADRNENLLLYKRVSGSNANKAPAAGQTN
jgi:4-amino-4-deoxy-L-arabinose transferase-like glycosyltransferase